MTEYLFIASSHTGERGGVAGYHRLACDLAGRAHPVTVFLVQNAVLPARAGADDGGLTALAGAGVTLLADDFSLRERGIAADLLRADVAPAPLESVIEHLARGSTVLWH